MEKKYKIFSMGFNKILDLVENVDENIANQYKKAIDIMPENVLDAVSCCEDFATDCEDFNVDFMRLQNAVSLDFSRNKKYLRFEIYVHRIYEDDLSPKKIFSINIRNTPRKQPDLQFYYEEKDGKYNLVRTSDKNVNKNVDLSWEIFLEYEDFEPYFVCKSYFRGVEVSSKQVDMSFDELTQYLEDDEAYEEDMEVEFDADFDL